MGAVFAFVYKEELSENGRVCRYKSAGRSKDAHKGVTETGALLARAEKVAEVDAAASDERFYSSNGARY